MEPTRVRANRIPSSGAAIRLGLAALVLCAACGAPGADEPGPEPVRAEAADLRNERPPRVDLDRSLAITDLPTLEATDPSGKLRFTLERVLAQIGATSGATHPPGALELYQRIFDTNNRKTHNYVPDGQHCDDEKDASGKEVINGFPIECPRQEGELANLTQHHPFCSGPGCDPYTPVAMTNRFDLAPANGQNCGQYRIVFGKGREQSPLATAGNPLPFNRVMIIFEAIVPNPHPEQGMRGCNPVIGFWISLSRMDDPAQRAAALDQFFFTGVPGFEPAVKFSHYSGAVDPVTLVQQGGQIRANQFMNSNDPTAPSLDGQMWQLREYNTALPCTGHGSRRACRARIRMVTTKLNPPASLYDEHDQSPAALAFRDPATPLGFLSQVRELARDDLNLINLNNLDPAFAGGQSTSSPGFVVPGLPPPTFQNDTNYNLMFDPSGPFAAAIQAELDKPPCLPLTPTEIVRRSQTQSCAGCHELSTSTAPFFGGMASANDLGPHGPGLSPLTWPDTAPEPLAPGFALNAFTQTTEMVLTPLPGATNVTCDAACTAHAATCPCGWALSPALTDVFLPFRRDNILKYVAANTTH
jgi:hypothetical protein